MRAYPTNSPQAAARIVALTMLADGHVCHSEMQALQSLHAAERLQLTPEQLRAVLQGLAQDLLASAYSQWGNACQMESHALDRLLEEVKEPGLRATTLALCQQVAQADGHWAPAEQRLMEHLAQHWTGPDAAQAQGHPGPG
ncbi:MAG: tellurite resistance TerB family protein [Simplicispira sp.]|nr:tellurite resistance TerB family protein [Simplicispira sp.]